MRPIRTFARISMVSVLVCLAGSLCADTVNLKNNRSLHGIIKDVSDRSIIIDTGFGTMAVSREDVLSFDKSPAAENAVQESISAHKAPAALAGLQTEMRRLNEKRYAVISAGREVEALEFAIENSRQEVGFLFGKFEKLNDELKRVKNDDVIKNNKLVAEINVVRASIEKQRRALEVSINNKEQRDRDYAQGLADYSAALQAYHQKSADLEAGDEAEQWDDSDRLIFNDLKKKADDMDRDFKKAVVAYTEHGGGVVVRVVLNGSVTATLMVDTGASFVFISEDLARRLNMDAPADIRTITCKLADGKDIEVRPVIFDSVEVAGMKLKHVQGAVSDRPPETGIDGLLGMSFLRNFMFRIDAKSKELILEEFTPSGQSG
ncbi:MAG: retropepsin-like aspartic protease [Candidatus Omnitrophica bacterium]|nr:retropepsin-like aspartic protease [Candidatus Omnitrophota bacterium]